MAMTRAAALTVVVATLGGAQYARAAGREPVRGGDALTAPKRDSVRVKFGKDTVTVVYSKVNSKDRVFGNAAKWDQPWPLGGDERTVLRNSVPLQLGGAILPAGSYTLFVIPQEHPSAAQCESSASTLKADFMGRADKPWVLVVSRQPAEGSPAYDQSQDVLRLPMYDCLLYTPESQFSMRLLQNGMTVQLAMVFDEYQAWVEFRPYKK